MGSPEGARKARERQTRESLSKAGAKGGKAKVEKGFAKNRKAAKSAGRLSGHVKRMKKRQKHD